MDANMSALEAVYVVGLEIYLSCEGKLVPRDFLGVLQRADGQHARHFHGEALPPPLSVLKTNFWRRRKQAPSVRRKTLEMGIHQRVASESVKAPAPLLRDQALFPARFLQGAFTSLDRPFSKSPSWRKPDHKGPIIPKPCRRFCMGAETLIPLQWGDVFLRTPPQ